MPVTIKLRNMPDYSKLYYHISNNSLSNEEILLDLSEHGFVEPMQIIILVQFIIYHIKNNSIRILLPSQPRVNEYLNDIGIIKFCATNYNDSNDYGPITSRTAMKIKRITTANMNDYITQTQNYFGEQCPGKDLLLLNILISELINNVYDHSKSPIDAYVFCQLFPYFKQIKLVVADLGMGIPNSVNNYLRKIGEKEKNNREAIEWAFSENRSTKSQPHNIGKGLYLFHEFVRNNQSTANVYTNSTRYSITPGKETFGTNPIGHFKGTLFEILIKVVNLPVDNKENVDLW